MDCHLILASQSPRRRQLLRLVNIPFTAVIAHVDEAAVSDVDPARDVVKTAVLKATYIAQSAALPTEQTAVVIAADTTVALGNEQLGKPHNAVHARQMLQMLRNRQHHVHTGICLIDLASGRQLEDVTTAVVTMRNYSDKEIDTYLASGDPLDKAGAYGIQHPQFRPVARLHGCYMGVMGLSICHLLVLLHQLLVPLKADLTALNQMHHPYDACAYFEKLTPLTGSA